MKKSPCLKIRDALDSRGREIFDRAIDLVSIRSISHTQGEGEIAQFIYHEISQWPYFKENPDYLKFVPIESSSDERQNVIAIVKGRKTTSTRTVLYLGHFDTVDIGEYGNLADVACDPARLHEKLAERHLSGDAGKELASGEWVFGRGIADMKTGVAILIQLLKTFSQKVDQLSGNIVMIIVGDEEADSLGMISAAKPLADLAEKEKLDFSGAINTDVVSQQHANEPDQRYMYLGSMGKIVPAVYIVGKAAHVGESLQGFDVNWLLSQLTCRINANMEFADHSGHLVSHPPMSLKQADLKSEYNGQLPYEGFAYYNFLTYQRGPREIICVLQQEVEASFKWCLNRLEHETYRYLEATGKEPVAIDIHPRVYTYDQIFEIACRIQGKNQVEACLKRIVDEHPKKPLIELRELSLALVRAVWKMGQQTGPAAVIFIMPPYYPPNNPFGGDDKFSRFNETVFQAAEGFQDQSPYPVSIEFYFPYLSDASFCAYQEDDQNRQILEANMPSWSRGWYIDIDNVRKLNIPVLDMGCHGKDFHRFLERVHVPYSMGVLPSLIEQMTEALLAEPPIPAGSNKK